MLMQRNSSLVGSLSLLSLLSLGACAGMGGPLTGEIETQLTADDTQVSLQSLPPASKKVTAINVTLARVVVRVDHNDVDIISQPMTIDLLKLKGSTFTSLGFTQIPAGRVDEIRMILADKGNEVVTADGKHHTLERPKSGEIRIDVDLKLDACSTGKIVLACNSDLKLKSEKDGDYELASTLKLKTVKTSGTCGPKPDAGGTDMLDPQCVNVSCPAGQVCSAGLCVPTCENVTCPTGQMCVAGACVTSTPPPPPPSNDPCKGVSCPSGQTCSNGKCSGSQPNNGGCHKNDGKK